LRRPARSVLAAGNKINYNDEFNATDIKKKNADVNLKKIKSKIRLISLRK